MTSRYVVHQLKPGRSGAAAQEPDAVLCEEPRWQVHSACGDPVSCVRCLYEIERARRAKVPPAGLSAPERPGARLRDGEVKP